MKREPICEGQMLPTEKSKKTMECGGEETAVKNWMTEECFSIFDSLDEPTYISDQKRMRYYMPIDPYRFIG